MTKSQAMFIYSLVIIFIYIVACCIVSICVMRKIKYLCFVRLAFVWDSCQLLLRSFDWFIYGRFTFLVFVVAMWRG